MIIVRLNGGLGNQLFQYAAGRRLAHFHDVPLKFDVSGFEKYKKRKFELDSLNMVADIADMENLI